MPYIAVTPLLYRDGDKEKSIRSGRPVPEELVDDSLIDCGAIALAEDDDDDTDGNAGPPGKALSRMNRAELDVVVAAEDVDIDAATTNADIVKAIEAKRLAAQA